MEYSAEDRIEYLRSIKPRLGDREVYVHYKGGVYVALGMARHTETGESLVIYQHLWPHYDISWKARPLANWQGLVPDPRNPGELIPRFLLVDFDKI